jgi:SAM-dependent methyltransferase
VIDLETARLMAMRDFLSGELHGISALSGRIEGLLPGTIRKIEENYGPELHKIIRGKNAGARAIMELCPKLEDDEVETVQELSRLSRFLRGETLPSDLIPGRASTGGASDLLCRHITVTPANRECRIDCQNEAFDRIGSSLVLSYIFDPLSALREFYRALKPGGVAVISSLKQNFDSSKSYLAEAKAIAERRDLGQAERTRLLDSLREFASFVGCVMELEDEGRFRFFATEELAALVQDAGFVNIEVFESFGEPATAAIIRAQKPDG